MSQSETKICQGCQASFPIDAEDLEFYQKVSPVIAGKTQLVPPPTLCPHCRLQRRLVWRNERTLYSRTCDKTDRQIISMYPAESPYTVYEHTAWWADDWEALQYGRDLDVSKPFFAQLEALLKAVPRPSLYNVNTVNSDYVNYTSEAKDSYMSAVVYGQSEDVHYCYSVDEVKSCVDCTYLKGVEGCYDCVSCVSCYDCSYSFRLQGCRDCLFSVNLTGCSDCLLSSNLVHKQYCIENVQYTKAEYQRKLKEYDFTSAAMIAEYKAKFNQIRLSAVMPYARIVNCEDCTGDELYNCKNVKDSFVSVNVQDSRYGAGQVVADHVYDGSGGGYEWCYEVNNTGQSAHCLFTSGVRESSGMLYSEWCHTCHDCFGCVGLRNKQYCILNKQYTKTEYERLVPQLIAAMRERGEWGEYFPMRLSPFGYNESVAQSYFPLRKDQAGALGAKWQTLPAGPSYDGPVYTPQDSIQIYIDSETERSRLLAGVLKCAVSGKPYKITPHELAFYLERKIPIPQTHSDVRFTERFGLSNASKLYRRQCQCQQSGHDHHGLCPNQFETPYPPESPNTVYCESCYQRELL